MFRDSVDRDRLALSLLMSGEGVTDPFKSGAVVVTETDDVSVGTSTVSSETSQVAGQNLFTVSLLITLCLIFQRL